MELHLDLVGGLAGDMFIAAVLDACPQHEAAVLAAIRSIDPGTPVLCALNSHRDAALVGRRFDVTLNKMRTAAPFAPAHVSHEHTTWKSIRSRIVGSSLGKDVKDHAIAIFSLLSEAEAAVHGVETEAVSFHEVGAWDSVADVIGAAVLIDALKATKWTASPAPLGSGRVNTSHGILPVPAPATVRLLLGMATIDDGIGGERVTPTGAAILRYLCPPSMGGATCFTAVRTLTGSGIGFGSRQLAGISNHLRVLCFETTAAVKNDHRQMHALEFEVDDQSGEELAAGLDRLRGQPGVLEVTQSPVFGKKGRMMIRVNVLARFALLDEVAASCFRETTTIGLRHRIVSGIGLKRRFRNVTIDGQTLRVKIVDRPGGRTAKAESDDVALHQGHARRTALRARAQDMALQEEHSEIND